MERKKKSLLGIEGFKGFTNTEKRCNRCGFVTFYLRVLYAHKYKCQGKLLGSVTCYYCKRKFNFMSSYYQHKKTCVKQYLKKKSLLKRKVVTKLIKTKGSESLLNKPSVVACPMCMELFASMHEYMAHTKAGPCSSKVATKKGTFSARKSLPKPQDVKYERYSESDELEEQQFDPDDSYMNNVFSGAMSYENKMSNFNSRSNKHPDYICMLCKNVYPSKEFLMRHLERNSKCAEAHYKSNSHISSHKVSFTARKSISARKSFPKITIPHRNHYKQNFQSDYYRNGGSARKSLPNSSNKDLITSKTHQPMHSPGKNINTCPVCYKSFSDSFAFLQHQKEVGHWGRAAKSLNANCKCPFCKKEFFSVRARNAHVRNHVDKSPEKIEHFLKSITCNICSQIFISEKIKQQHIKITHAKKEFESRSVKKFNQSNSYHKQDNTNKHSLLPLVMKQKLKEYPNTCPICSKDFSSTHHRNRHFQERHLASELECTFCPLKFNSIDNLEYHMQESHYDDFKFECLACKINLATAPHVVLHVTKVHADQDPKDIIHCRVTESVSSNQEAVDSTDNMTHSDKLISGIQLHRGKNEEFYCDICGIHFQKLCGLTSHRQSKLHRDTLVRNLDEMHKSLSNLPPSPPPAPKKPVPQPEILTCSECSEEYTSIKDFVPHRLSHFGVKSKYMKINEMNIYKCEICNEESDSHSKVQMHLFWHLQVESTSSGSSSSKDRKKTDPIVPDRLSGQHVAKKSFSKQTSESQQEVVIGGIKKPLFTCESCKIGFTTQSHYSLHVRKFCKMRNTPTKNISVELEETNKEHSDSSSQEMNKSRNLISSENHEINHCSTCNCLFCPSVAEIHEEFCKKCAQRTSELNFKIIRLKVNMKHKNAVATCITCSSSFDNPQRFSHHMLTKHASQSHNEKDANVYCTSCNCLFFSSDALENHEVICSNFSYCEFDIRNNKNILKATSIVNDAIAVCITCCLTFKNDQILNEHISMHKNKLPLESGHQNDENISSSYSSNNFNKNQITESNTASISDTADHLTSTRRLNVSQNGGEMEHKVDSTEALNSPEKSLNFTTLLPNDSLSIESVPDSSTPTITDKIEEDPVDKLRKNFSQLLCILINDSDLMCQLGYGEQPVDDVLINVLQQMGQSPTLKDDKITDLDCLRKNIQILLDFCLKDQIMELIGNGKTSTDDIVIEALKMFTSDDSVPVVTAE